MQSEHVRVKRAAQASMQAALGDFRMHAMQSRVHAHGKADAQMDPSSLSAHVTHDRVMISHEQHSDCLGCKEAKRRSGCQH